MFERSQIHEGMVVRSSEGKRLGRVLATDEGAFTVEKGFLWVTDYVAQYQDVSDILGEEIRLSRAKKEVPHLEHRHAQSVRSSEEPQCYGEEGGGGRK